MAVAEIKIWPVGTSDASIAPYIRECFRLAEESQEVEAVLTPTSTVLDGPLSAILALADQMHHAPFGLGADRVLTSITIDERLDKETDMEEMVDSVLNDENGPGI